MINISVITPVFKGRPWIKDCLDSLTNQTYPANQYELIFVFNGPDDGTKDFVETFSKENKNLNIITLSNSTPSASLARNLGAAKAKGEYITWIDVDDWVSSNYLELLADSASPDVIPFAQIINIDLKGRYDPYNPINAELLAKDKSRISPTDFVRAMTFMTAKLIPSAWVRALPLSGKLRSGEDVAFYADLMSKYEFSLELMPAAAGAIYFRRITQTSVSRGDSSKDFLVTQRADVIEHLANSWSRANKSVRPSIMQMMRSQASFIRRFVNENPDLKIEVFDEIVARKIDGFPWDLFQGQPSKLVIAYNFAPYSDTGAVVAAKRIRSDGRAVDIISNNMSRVRDKHRENLLLSRPYTAWSEEIPTPAYFASDKAVESFVKSGLEIYEKWISKGRSYDSVYSRSMWPASHFLAAAIKIRNPEIEWVAEFSDPARVTTTGEYRYSKISSESLQEYFLAQGPTAYSEILLREADVFSWTELLPYMFADGLIFTNENQLEIMLKYAPKELESLISNKAIIEQQPTLPPIYYSIESSCVETNVNELNIGYFGEFYNTRGLSEVIHALGQLEDEKLSKVRLWIFSSDTKSVVKDVDPRVLSQIVNSNKMRYFEFLNTLEKFDYLIVNDATTLGHHPINPYLPSKLSDYSGSKSRIWGIIEPGSGLSRENLDYKSIIGDTQQAFETIKLMLTDKFVGNAHA